MADYNRAAETDAYQMRDITENQAGEGVKGWDMDPNNFYSQQLVKALYLCDEFLWSHSLSRSGVEKQEFKGKPRLSDYACLGP